MTNKIAILSQVVLCATLGGCKQPSPSTAAQLPDSVPAANPVAGGEPDSITPQLAWVAQGQNGRDTVRLVMEESETVYYPTVIVSGPRHQKPIRFRTQIDGLPVLAAFGDLDGNGWRDVVLLSADESSTLAQVVMVSADSLWDPPTKPAKLWQRTQFFRQTQDLSRACEEAVYPKIVRDSSGDDMLSVAAGEQADGRDCGPIRHVLLTVRDGILQVGTTSGRTKP